MWDINQLARVKERGGWCGKPPGNPEYWDREGLGITGLDLEAGEPEAK